MSGDANEAPAPTTPPPGEPARWVTVYTVYDADDRVISERTTDIRDRKMPTYTSTPPPGQYL